MTTHTVNAEKKSQRNVWIAAGGRTPFVRVDGPLLQRDSLSLSVPVARAMAEQVKGPIDFAVWGPVILNLAYNNLAREVWLEAKLEPHVPTFTTIMQCSTSIRYCRARGIGELFGEVLSGNERMLALAEDLGFEIHHRPDPQTFRVCLKLQPD